jgi:hypothetical protein
MTIADTSHPTGLNPKSKFFAEIGGDCINVDGAIEICRKVDTPQARTIYRAFRKSHAIMRQKASDLSAEKIRENAFFEALESLGFKMTFTPISGNMD